MSDAQRRGSPAVTRDEVMSILRQHADELRRRGAGALYLFGSAARDEARPDSDIDLFFEANENARSTWAQYPELQDYLARILGGRRIDLAPRDSLRPSCRSEIEASAVRVF